jgi:aldehyde dehydrogenase (NAD+)
MSNLASLNSLRDYFKAGATQSIAFRKEQLKNLKKTILKYEQELYEALYKDLRKSKEEVWVTETGMVLTELNQAIKNIEHWTNPEQVPTNLLNLPSVSKIYNEPLGVVLIIGPWNYPFQLLINPLIGAIAAGNCVVLKPSEFAGATASVMKKIIEESFASNYVLYVEGDGATVIAAMMNDFRFNHVFYTGSTVVGRLIYKMAADKLVPVTLELGGKSPCIIEADANLRVAARRIVMTKFSNAGQMCVAPDYILVDATVKEELIQCLKESIVQFFTENPETCYNYGRIINEKQFDRLQSYLAAAKIIHGGKHNKSDLFVEPTIVDEPALDSALMKEEIFGPILPVLSFTTAQQAIDVINKNSDPLSFYVYTGSKQKETFWLQQIPAGGVCINNSSWHLTNHHLPFGGRGNSGTGAYHGYYSFKTFSHQKSVMKTPTWFDPAMKYPPFKGKLKLFKWLIK